MIIDFLAAAMQKFQGNELLDLTNLAIEISVPNGLGRPGFTQAGPG